MENCQRYEYWIIRVYVEISGVNVSGIEQIPERAFQLITSMTHNERVKPFIVLDLTTGTMSRKQIATKYEVSEGFVRHIGRTLSVFI